MTVFGFLLTALYVPVLTGGAVTPRWGVIAIGLPFMLWWLRIPLRLTFLHLVGLALFAWCALLLIWTPNRLDGLDELIQFGFLGAAVWLGSAVHPNSIARIFTGMAYGLLLSSATLILQIWLPDIVTHVTTHAGLFSNSGTLAETAAVILVALLVANQNWWLILGILPCVVMPMSRGAFLGLGAALVAWIWKRQPGAAVFAVMCAISALIVSLALGFHVDSATDRISMWLDAIAGLTWLGHGIGSVWTDYAFLNHTYNIVIERPEHLHNDFLEIMFEGGIVGSIFCAMAGYLVIRQVRGLAKMVLATVAAEALVGFPLHNPTTAFVAALALGTLARDWPDLHELRSRGRLLLFAERARRHGGNLTAA